MDPGPPPTSDGRGTGTSRPGGVTTSRQGGRGSGRGGRHSRRNLVPTIPRQRFDGATEELKGHIFDLVGSRSADLFIKSKRLSLTMSDGPTNIPGISDERLKPLPFRPYRYQQPRLRIPCHLSSLPSLANKLKNT